MTPSAEELRLAIEAVQAHYPDVEIPPNTESWVSDEVNQRIVYLNATRREGLAAGTPYGTWIVTFMNGTAVEVSRVDSLACAPSKTD